MPWRRGVVQPANGLITAWALWSGLVLGGLGHRQINSLRRKNLGALAWLDSRVSATASCRADVGVGLEIWESSC